MSVSITEFVEMHMGFMDAVCEDGETTDLSPMWIATVFNNQRDFDPGCGWWAGQGMLVLRKEEAPKFSDRLAWMLRDLDTRFINDRPPGFEVCRVTLPSFELVFDDGVVLKVEVLANFFGSRYFDIVYVYRGLNLPLAPRNLWRLWNWDNAETIRLPRVVVEVLGIDLPEEDLMRFQPGDYLEADFKMFQSLGFLNGKTDFLLAFIAEYLKGNRPTIARTEYDRPIKSVQYRRLTYTYAFYSLQRGRGTTRGIDLSDLRRLLENRPEWFIFNERVALPLVDVTMDPGHRRVVGPKYSVSLVTDASRDESRHEARERASADLLHIIEYLLFEKARLVLALRELDQTSIESLPKRRLWDLKRSLLDLATSKPAYLFSSSELSTLVLTLKQALGLDGLERDFEKSYSKIEQLIEKKESEETDRLNLKISLVAVLLSIPVVADVVDIVATLFASPNWVAGAKLLATLVVFGWFYWRFGRGIRMRDSLTESKAVRRGVAGSITTFSNPSDLDFVRLRKWS